MEQSVGKSVKRFDSVDKVTGKALFPGDINFRDQVFMRTLFSPSPHAIIKQVECTDALKIPGVIAVLTAEDVPLNEYGLITNDQPVLCGPNSSKEYSNRTRFIGAQIALIIAEDDHIAKKAARMIRVEYQTLDILTSPNEALAKNAAIIHPDHESNILFARKIDFGCIDNAFEEADIVIESVYHTPAQEHVFLQPEAGIAYYDEQDRITVITGGQWAHGDQRQIAHALQVPEEKVRVIYAAIGGAFGGKEDISVQIGLALAVMRLNEMGIHRPVKTVWSRKESIYGHPKRHPFTIHAKWGAKANGKITAASMDMVADAGAYASSTEAVLSVATSLAIGPYYIPNVYIHARAVYTNNIPNGAFRAFGSPQVTFAAEMQINKLAHALGIDPVEFRMRNLIREGELTPLGTPLPQGISIENVLRTCAIKAGWKKMEKGWQLGEMSKVTKIVNSSTVKGIGIAAGYKSFGIPPDECWAAVEIFGEENIEKVTVWNAGADLGQGAHSVYKQFASSVLGVSDEIIEVIASDTSTSENSGSASSSRITFMAGNAILGAAKIAQKKWQMGERSALGEFLYRAPKILSGRGNKIKEHPNFGYGYVAQAVEVEIDKETGASRVLRVISVNDVGRAINPLQVKGQIEGAVIQALGFAKLENFRQENGEPITNSLATYLVPTIMDIPAKLESVIIEEPDPNGPLGARGMGEMPFVPFAPAFTSAVHDAVGVWFDQIPLLPENYIYMEKPE